MGILVMSKKEREQLKVIGRLDAGEITQEAAAEMLNWTDRWVREKLRRYRAEGDAGLVHKNRGKVSQRRWDPREQSIAIELLKSEWRGFGPTFASEKLAELKGIKVSDETLRKAMIANGLWRPGKKKQKHRKRRERKLMQGVLVQLDGSPHDWFEGRGPRCTLLVFIDDATSKILWLEFAESESFKGVAGATKKYMKVNGRPVSFYVDYGSVFSVNLNNPERDKKTQFEMIMKDLSVDISHARSPQAKGRVERANKTMQDRLVKEMRLVGISSIDQANDYLRNSDFIANHNAKFAVPPAQKQDAHRSISGYDLDNIFCTRETRVVTNDFTVQYNRRVLQIEKSQAVVVRPKNKVVVCENLDGELAIRIRNTNLNFKELPMRKQNKLSPVEYVNLHRDEPAASSFPFLGNLEDSQCRDVSRENRKFSCW